MLQGCPGGRWEPRVEVPLFKSSSFGGTVQILLEDLSRKTEEDRLLYRKSLIQEQKCTNSLAQR